jgi:hypothetical protein
LPSAPIDEHHAAAMQVADGAEAAGRGRVGLFLLLLFAGLALVGGAVAGLAF